jgi:hypothetical protein
MKILKILHVFTRDPHTKGSTVFADYNLIQYNMGVTHVILRVFINICIIRKCVSNPQNYFDSQ